MDSFWASNYETALKLEQANFCRFNYPFLNTLKILTYFMKCDTFYEVNNVQNLTQ